MNLVPIWNKVGRGKGCFMRRKLFCEISPLTYRISLLKCRLVRYAKDLFERSNFAVNKSEKKLPIVIFKHESLIRRTLGKVDKQLQENKAINLSIATPKVDGILIRPGEVFSFWKLVGNTSANKGYKKGLMITNSQPTSGVGGGMCQFTNLLHWMVLHSPLDIIEHHHHDEYDLFPDCERKVPFGTGTSIAYNYLDYRVKNNTDMTFQFVVSVSKTHLCGELRTNKSLDIEYDIVSENERFVRENDIVYRRGSVYRKGIDKSTGEILFKELLRTNNAKVLYDTASLVINDYEV